MAHVDLHAKSNEQNLLIPTQKLKNQNRFLILKNPIPINNDNNKQFFE